MREFLDKQLQNEQNFKIYKTSGGWNTYNKGPPWMFVFFGQNVACLFDLLVIQL